MCAMPHSIPPVGRGGVPGDPLGIALPYVTDGGNLTLEFTIQAADVRGAAQVFSSSFAFGTVPLQVIQ